VNVPSNLRIPHSRWNDVYEGSLVESGYRILTKSAKIGVDCFVKRHSKSLFVYFQGHPEYEAQTLLGEYRRDIGRFLRREAENYPAMPRRIVAFDGQDFRARSFDMLRTGVTVRVSATTPGQLRPASSIYGWLPLLLFYL
jgi:homoserine O-succinyltransferase